MQKKTEEKQHCYSEYLWEKFWGAMEYGSWASSTVCIICGMQFTQQWKGGLAQVGIQCVQWECWLWQVDEGSSLSCSARDRNFGMTGIDITTEHYWRRDFIIFITKLIIFWMHHGWSHLCDSEMKSKTMTWWLMMTWIWLNKAYWWWLEWYTVLWSLRVTCM